MNTSAIDEFVRRSRIHSMTHTRRENGRPDSSVAIVACMDARLNIERVFRLSPGEAHVIRNAGGTVTDDVLRSLLVSQRELGTTSVMLIHHTDCGMTRLDEPLTRARILEETRQHLPFALLGFSDAEQDLCESMRRVASCAFLPHRQSVRGFVFDVVSGALREVTVK